MTTELLADSLERLWVLKPRDPAKWISKRLNVFAWSKQVEILNSLHANRRTAVRSCHGAGKSWIASAAAAWWIDTHPLGEAIVVTTAPTAVQVNVVLWEELRKRHKEGHLPGKISLSAEWKTDDGVIVGLGRKPSDTDEHGFQGIHRRYVLVIIDEACGVPTQLWTAVEAITTGQDCKILAIGNPDDPSAEFANACKPGSGWNVIGISAFDTPNLSGEDVPPELGPLLPNAEWVEDKRKRWGAASPRYQSKVLGEFPEIGIDTLIAPAHILRAQVNEFPAMKGGKIGIDVARFGADMTIISHMAPNGRFRILDSLPMTATTEVSGRAIARARELAWPDITIDGIGVGAGVVDELREAKREGVIPNDCTIRDFQAGGAATDPDYGNARAQAMWALREMFEEDGIDIDPDDDELAAQLGSIKYRFDARGRIFIESKDEMVKRGLPSPDRADAMYLASTRLGAVAAANGSMDKKLAGKDAPEARNVGGLGRNLRR